MSAVAAASDKPRKSSPGHGGRRPGAGRPKNEGQHSAYEVLAKAKAKRETFKAQLAELEYQQARGELVRADDVEAAWADHIQTAKGRLLALPSRVAPRVQQEAELRKIEEIIRDELFDILAELAGADDQ